MKRPFLERVVVVLWLLCGGVAAVTAFIGIAGLYDILSQPMNNTADPWARFELISPAPPPPQGTDPWAGFRVVSPAPATMREQPRFDAEGARRAGYSETEILAFLSQNRMLGDIAVNNAGHVMIFREGAWSRASVAQNQQGEQIFYDGAAWKPVPAAWEKASAQTEVGPWTQYAAPAAPQRGLGERVARVISQIDTVTVVFLLLPSLLCIAFVSLFQYLVLGFFSPLALFRSRK